MLKGFALEPTDIVDHMREKIEMLGEESGFVFVDLAISEDDLELFRQLQINVTRQYNLFGNLDRLRDELSIFLREIGDNEESLIQKITRVIFQIASNVKEASNKEAVWVCIRASTPNHLFDVPRWHQDGYYFFPYAGFVFKFAAALKGNPTLFCSHLDERGFSGQEIKSPCLGQGAFFIVGDKERGAVHSEPKIDSERLFISILPGSESEIKELKARW